MVTLLLTLSTSALDLYVAPNGNDASNGTSPNINKTEGPLATLQGAREHLRTLRSQNQLHEPVHVIFADGTYSLNSPITFAAEDSGTADAPITYEAAPNAHPIFTGGQEIKFSKTDADGTWLATIPTIDNKPWHFEQLWINGHRVTPAKSPNELYFYATGAALAGNDPTNGDPKTLTKRAFRARHQNIAPLLSLTPDELHAVIVTVYHAWETSRHHIAAIDGKTNTIFLTGQAYWPIFQWKPQRYQLENFPAALDAPGEWFLDAQQTLHYKPLPAEEMAAAHAIAPLADSFINIAGDLEQSHPVEHLTFRGLTFEYGQYLLPPEGHSDAQAEVSIPGSINLNGARDITFDDCQIAHIGTYAIWFHMGCENCRVTHCHLHDLGAGGVRIGEGKEASKEVRYPTGHITVDNCIINDGCRIHAGAVGVWIGQSAYNQITHNEIADLLYTGISVGWRWGYKPSLANHNKIEFNHIHHIGQGVLSDMGGVYTLGISDGTTVSNNHIHDIDCFKYGGWGLYNDEGSTHITMENNLVHDTKSGGYHFHYGKENIIRNNIFAFGRDAQLVRSVTENHLSFTFQNNIVYWDSKAPLMAGIWQTGQFDLDHNDYWNAGGLVTFEGLDLKAWQANGKDAGSIIADPKFVDPAKRDFHLQPDSPALTIGFKPFDYTRAGVYGDAAWITLAKSLPMPKLTLAPAAP